MEPERNVIPMPKSEAHAAAAAAQPSPSPVSAFPAEAEAEHGSANNIDKIRDIIFGAQMRDYDKRFVRLEERLLKEAADLRDDTRRRFDTLETYIKNELAALAERLKADAHRRDELNDDLGRQLQETARGIERKLAHLDEQNDQAQRELRQQLLDQSKRLNDEIRQKYDELTAALAREASELRHDKTDRAALADLFTELAMRLNNQFHLPGE
jgi:DNA anti-recombination protein RmuC